jgi:hypothetical protein
MRWLYELLLALFGFGPVASKRPEPQPVALRLSPHDVVTLGDACEGVLVLGGTGSGKTSGPGFHLACNLLRLGCGFLVLSAKEDEARRWLHLCEVTGRSGDVEMWGPGHPHAFDFLMYELAQNGPDSAGYLLDQLVELTNRTGGKESEPFWSMTAQRLLRAVLHVLMASRGPFSVMDIMAFLRTMPADRREAESAGWRENSFAGQELAAAEKKAGDSLDLKLAKGYLLQEHIGMTDKTRVVVEVVVANTLAQLVSGPFAPLISGGRCTITPDALFGGKVIILDGSYLKFKEPARFAQICWKLSTQRAVLGRAVTPESRPVVIWQDEYQLFSLPSNDCMVQSVARSQKLVSVMLSQSYPVLVAALGKSERAQVEVQALAGNMLTRIFCQNSCPETNRAASELIGESLQHQFTFSSKREQYDLWEDLTRGGKAAEFSFREEHQPECRPSVFPRLLKGGARNRGVVTAVCHLGRVLSNGKTWMEAEFLQEGF